MAESALARLHRESGAERWQVTPEAFAEALTRSATKAFTGRPASPLDIEKYQGSLHLADLALACACDAGNEAAWEHFVTEFRPALYRAADAIDRTGRAREIADGLYAELFSRSLFRYFHGRSSLATWLRSLVSQRYVDRYRDERRQEPLPDESSPSAMPARPSADHPDRARFVAAMQSVLAAALAALAPRDRLRLRCYYAQEMTLVQIGRVTRESEATVSRQLTKTRKELRAAVEQRLRDEHRFAAAEIADCFSSVSADAGTLDLAALFDDRKISTDDRSRHEDVS